MKKAYIWSAAAVTVTFVGAGTFFAFSGFDSSESSDSSKRTLVLSKMEQSSKIAKEQQVMMNDPAINQAWGLKKSDAARAWEVSKGSRKIVVAVIDTGAEIKHEDLSSNIWKNEGESGTDSLGRNKASNKVDDDGNGFVDDINGWDFVTNTPNLVDNHGHGTHIAGIIGAAAGNGKGIAGIAPEVSLMILKYYDPKVPKTDNLKNTVNAIKYAVKMKAHIINYSGGGTEFSQEEFEAIKEAQKQGILFVAAAGNERSNSDKHKYYPADYGLTNIISVTAIDPTTEVLSSSNYGIETVDIAAPGQNILSTLPNGSYGYMTGTSQATAFVTGAAVLVMAHRDQFQAEDVKKYILATGASEPSLIAKCRTSKQLNLFKALTILDSGVGVSGVVAANTVDLEGFTSQGAARTTAQDNTARITGFGKALIQNLESNLPGKKN